MEMVNAVLSRRGQVPVRRNRAPEPLLDGVKRAECSGRPDIARRLGPVLAERGEVAYWIVAGGQERLGDRRVGARGAMRMRSAKLLDAAFRYLCDCRICDRSLDGLRLLLARNVRLPRRFAVHIDESGDVRRARAVWRRGLFVGVRLHEPPPSGAVKPNELFALRARYYGILD